MAGIILTYSATPKYFIFVNAREREQFLQMLRSNSHLWGKIDSTICSTSAVDHILGAPLPQSGGKDEFVSEESLTSPSMFLLCWNLEYTPPTKVFLSLSLSLFACLCLKLVF
jgi:hypothetical protein